MTEHLEIAGPGHPDLDCVIIGHRVTAVYYSPPTADSEHELIVSGRGGKGWWVDTNGELADLSAPDSNVDYMEFHGGWSHTKAPKKGELHLALMKVVGILNEWRDNETPISIYCAPGKMTQLRDGEGRSVPLPRAENWNMQPPTVREDD